MVFQSSFQIIKSSSFLINVLVLTLQGWKLKFHYNQANQVLRAWVLFSVIWLLPLLDMRFFSRPTKNFILFMCMLSCPVPTGLIFLFDILSRDANRNQLSFLSFFIFSPNVHKESLNSVFLTIFE